MNELELIRESLSTRPAVVRDHELLAVILGKGVSLWPQGRRKILTAVQLGEDLLQRRGGLRQLVETPPEDILQLDGVGKVLGPRLLALVQLALRFDRGHRDVEKLALAKTRLGSPEGRRYLSYQESVRERLRTRPEELTDGEILAAFLDVARPSFAAVERLAARGSGLASLLRSIAASDLAPYRLRRGEGCRLLAGAEVARRYHTLVEGRLREIARDLPLTFLALGEQLLEAVAHNPQPDLIVRSAHLFRLAHDVMMYVVSGRRAGLPDLEILEEALRRPAASTPAGP